MEDGLVHTIVTFVGLVYSVLILVVMEDGLVQYETRLYTKSLLGVLILVVMEDGLVLVSKTKSLEIYSLRCLNPCCNGRWSRT